MTKLSLIRTALVAIALGGSSFVAVAPTQAAPPNIEFGFSIGGGGPNVHIGTGGRRDCLSDNQVRRLLRGAGYDEIRFIDRGGRIVTVRAEKGRRDYRISVDSCRGRIVDVDRIRR